MSQAKPDAASPPEFVEPAEVRARWEPAAARLRLRLAGGAELDDACARMAFPVSAPGTFVEFCDAEGQPVGMLRSMEGLEPESRKAVEAALASRYLTPRVLRVLELEEVRPLLLRWRVHTDRGERTFHTESPREAVRHQGPDRIRVTDLTGSHYDVPSLAALDAASLALLSLVL